VILELVKLVSENAVAYRASNATRAVESNIKGILEIWRITHFKVHERDVKVKRGHSYPCAFVPAQERKRTDVLLACGTDSCSRAHPAWRTVVE
jgi:hypothetical protein